MGLFWPEADDEHGRHSLRQALYRLRSEVGQDLVLAGASLWLDPAYVRSDVGQFRAALEAGDRTRAAGLYRGPFLDGFYLSQTPEFERWAEQERGRLAGAAAAALLGLANEAATLGDRDAAANWWYQLTLLEPLSGRFAIGYIRALAACGDRAKALAFVRSHQNAVRRELEAEPDPDLRRLEAELRAMPEPQVAAAPRNGGASGSQDQPATVSGGGEPDSPALDPGRHRRRWYGRSLALAGLAMALVAILAAVSTQRGSMASRFYEEGLRAFYAPDHSLAKRLMGAALREDSTFAMAAYYDAVMTDDGADEARQRALRLARRAPERERLMIVADLLQRDQEPGALPAAEEWAAKYPDDARAFATLGSALASAGDYARAAAALERSISLDVEAERIGQEGCRVCDGYERLADLYFWWDSLPAVERTARRYLDAHPDQPLPWATLAFAAARAGDSASALQHLRRYVAATATRPGKSNELRIRLTLEEYDVVEREALPLLASSRPDEAYLGRWMLLIALRNQGRLDEAAHLLRTGQIRGSPPPVVPVGVDNVNQGLVFLESGDPSRAASTFDTRRRMEPRAQASGLRARWRAWNTTLTATALAAVGDTMAVRRLADTVQYWGDQSLFGRDRKAHHFLRGLVLAAAGHHEDAAGEYRAAVHSYTLGYTRINYELAKCLLRLGRPQEAVAVLLPALRGEIDAANLYVTRTDLHELLALAYHRSGMPDSAAAHDRAVVRAWAHADPRFASRREAARRRLTLPG